MVIGDLALCAASGFAIVNTGEEAKTFGIITFGICFVHGLSGILAEILPKNEDMSPGSIEKIHDMTLSLVELLPLPFINTELYLKTDLGPELSYGHAYSVLVPLAVEIISGGSDTASKVKQLAMTVNICSLIYLAVIKENAVYGGMAVAMLANSFGKEECSKQLDMSGCEFLSLGLAVFVVLSSFALQGAGS